MSGKESVMSLDTYEPISSVWTGADSDLLAEMLDFYSVIEPEPILDATYNTGRMWGETERKITSMDINPRYSPDIVADNRQMPIADEMFAVIVYDPPHVGPQGRDKSRKRFDTDFGATMACGKEHGWSLSYLYPSFLDEAMRVLKPDGLLFAKITDMVNNHRSRWAHVDFIQMASDSGFIVCDLIVKVREGPMVSSKWKRAHHARKRHCFWIICRKSDKCERITGV